ASGIHLVAEILECIDASWHSCSLACCCRQSWWPPSVSLLQTACDIVDCLGRVDEVCFVDDEQVTNLCEACLESLDLIAQLRHQNYNGGVDCRCNLNLCLAGSHSLDDNDAHPGRVQYTYRVSCRASESS